MPVCPYCKKELKSLRAIERLYLYHRAYVKNGELIIFPSDTEEAEPDEIVAFACPYCDHIIATTKEEALDFMLDRKLPKDLVPVEKKGDKIFYE
ncbi:MAG: hypothetical protein RXO36_03445 [Candidatus Nanopusillus acidilobi]|jgi:uncharacterized protein YbaR (Trm112 family)